MTMPIPATIAMKGKKETKLIKLKTNEGQLKGFYEPNRINAFKRNLIDFGNMTIYIKTGFGRPHVDILKIEFRVFAWLICRSKVDPRFYQ